MRSTRSNIRERERERERERMVALALTTIIITTNTITMEEYKVSSIKLRGGHTHRPFVLSTDGLHHSGPPQYYSHYTKWQNG